MYMTVCVYATPTPHRFFFETESQYHLIFIEIESQLLNCQTFFVRYERFFSFFEKRYI